MLFFPILLVFLISWIIYRKLWGKKQSIREQKRQETEKKLLAHIRNFSPTRLKNRTWQKSIGKSKKKRKELTKYARNK